MVYVLMDTRQLANTLVRTWRDELLELGDLFKLLFVVAVVKQVLSGGLTLRMEQLG